METGSNSPIKDFGEGLGKGAVDSIIENGSKGIKHLIERFKSGKLAFIQERTTIDKAKELLESNEHNFYCNYIKDKDKRTIAVMGLTLRRLDQDDDRDRRENLVKKIRKKFDVSGLHLAYLVQNGILSRYLTILLENVKDSAPMIKRLNEFLGNCEKFAYFVNWKKSIEQVAEEVKAKLISNSPEIYVISGIGNSAETVVKSFELIKGQVTIDYEFEKSSTTKREVIFLLKKDSINLK